MCTFKNDIGYFEVKVDVQKGAVRFRVFFDNRRISSSHSYFHPLLSYDNSPQ